jgi:drug/metabolite transporter (DMT)-like permease
MMRVTAIALVMFLALRSGIGVSRNHAAALSGMGILDAAALGAITFAASQPDAEFAAVVASVFGIVTVLLARVFLGERVNAAQWGSILLVFAGLGALGA